MSKCCEKYAKKGRFCKDCPQAEGLTKKQRKKLIKKLQKS
jgi:hypothetical protein